MTSVQKGWAAEILYILDDFAEQYLFPMPDNANFHYAGMRSSSFRNVDEWLIVFEEISYSPASYYHFANRLHAYGNKLEGHYTNPDHPSFFNKQGDSLWDKDGQFRVDKWSFELVINEEQVAISAQPDDFVFSGIAPSDVPTPLDFLRFLIFKFRPKLFLTSDKLLELTGRIDSGLERFHCWDDWHHPRIAEDERPSQIQCFKNLAIALDEDNPELALCSAEEDWNTHWKNW